MVSIIILSFNTKKLLESCLHSIFSRVKKGTFEVIVVDNASTDESVKMVQETFPQVKIIINKENFGFAKGCNIGAIHAKGEYLLFLNSDTIIKEDPLPSLMDVSTKKADIAVVGGEMINSDGTIESSHGRFYSIETVFTDVFLARKKMKEKKTVLREIDWVSGGFMLIKKDVYEKLNGFDEHFFMYVEDMELCFRVKKSGLHVYYNPEAKIQHLGQGSSNRTFAIVSIYKGIHYFFKKHKTHTEYQVVRFLLLLKAWAAIIIGIVTRNTYLIKTYKEAVSVL